MKYLAIDLGDKRTGLAVCDPMEIVCSPLCVIDSQPHLDRVLDAIADEQPEQIIIGLPLNMDGTEGFQAKKVRKFAAALAKKCDLPINFQDERQTSVEAKMMISAADFTRKKKKKRLDAVAAAAILQAFIDNKNSPQQ